MKAIRLTEPEVRALEYVGGDEAAERTGYVCKYAYRNSPQAFFHIVYSLPDRMEKKWLAYVRHILTNSYMILSELGVNVLTAIEAGNFTNDARGNYVVKVEDN